MAHNFNNEYPCTYVDEHKFLQRNGFRYNFVKIVDGVTTWKYPKSAKLYEKLMEFYK